VQDGDGNDDDNAHLFDDGFDDDSDNVDRGAGKPVCGAMRSRITATVIGAAILIGGYAATQGGGGAEAQANVFAVASGGSPNCLRSSTLKTYAQAIEVNAVCGPGVRTSNGSINGTGFGNSCHAATAGDRVGVKNGTYTPPGGGFLLDGNLDCSDGVALDYNPNWEEQGLASQESRLANWVTFVSADSTPAIRFQLGAFVIPWGNYHMIWENIDINTGVKFNYGGESAGQQAKNIIFRGSSVDNLMTVYGIQIIGSKNILLQNINNGPSLQCAKNDANVPTAWRCNPSGPWFESQYADWGVATGSCNPESPGLDVECGGWWAYGGTEWAELFIHDGGSFDYENIRLENFFNHDQQSIQDSSCCAHPGCLMHIGGDNGIITAHNTVLDHYVCERAAGASIQFSDSGVTVQNSVFGCQVQSLENSGGDWDGTCVANAFGMGSKIASGGTGFDNVLIRYNYFGPTVGLLIQNDGVTFANSFSNVRIVGNLFGGQLTCGVSGVTYDSNSFVSGLSACGTNSQSLAAGDPVVQSSYGTPDDLYVLEGPTMDPSLDGSPSVQTVNPTGDLNLDHDFEGDARSNPTHVGPDH
jgi:hypothetical protein